MKTKTNEVTEFCERYDACASGREFAAKYKTMAEVWDACERVDWLLWIYKRTVEPMDMRELRMFACWCVRETPLKDGRKVWDLLTDGRSRNAVVVAERFALGGATDQERAQARAAAAAAAAYAAAYAAAAYAAYAAAAYAAAAYAAYAAAAYAAAYAAYAAAAYAAAYAAAAYAADAAAYAAAGKFQAAEFRRRFGNPFRK